MSDSGTAGSNDGAYTITNSLKGGSTFLPLSGRTLYYADGQLTIAKLSCGGEQEDPVVDQYYEHQFTQATDPGSSEQWYSPVPKGKFLKPAPSDESWTLTYQISAPGNTLGGVGGTIPVARHQNTVCEFRYYLDQTNGAAWYSLAIYYVDLLGLLPFGVDAGPSEVVQIGNFPAVHVS